MADARHRRGQTGRHASSRLLSRRGADARRLKPATQLKCLLTVAQQAQRAQVVKVALSSAFHHGQDVIGIPQRLPVEPFKSPSGEKPQPMGSARTAQFPIGGPRIDPAERANAAIPLQNLLAKIAWVAA